MGKVKCSYCGSFIDDALTNCPHCGAVNEYLVRYAKKTPKTIEELQQWYTARNLPPEDVSRFYIGKDVKKPRAFGIYKKDGRFTVYKNKSDGTRAVRYSGTDEAYAVNEIYMKLKEEILNQKNRNLAAKTKASGRTAPSRSSRSAPYRPVRSGTGGAFRGLFSNKFSRTLIIVIILAFLGSLIEEPEYDRYYDGGSIDTVYFASHQDRYEWWRYDDLEDSWELDETYSSGATRPFGIKKDHEITYEELISRYDGRIPECVTSRSFVDAHHPPVSSGYYIYDDSVYYYLNNRYGYNSGWYTYDDGDWDYYCDEDDKELLGEELWYDTDSYYSSYDYDSLDSDRFYYYGGDDWITDFSDTEFYQTYEQNESDYYSSYSDQDDDSGYSSWDDDDDDSWWDWDDDSSWDWDSGSDWDSGWSDWDSDW